LAEQALSDRESARDTNTAPSSDSEGDATKFLVITDQQGDYQF
jgi:hypothetical protein